MQKPPSNKEEIIEEIRRTSIELGRRPSRSAFITHTGISEYMVLKHFQSWNRAVEAAGLEPDITNIKIEDDALLEDWGGLVRKLRQIPTRVQYRLHGNYSPGVFERHFGPWSQVPDKFREFAKGKPEWNDVLALLPIQTTSVRSTDISQAISEIPTESARDSFSSATPQKYKKLNDRPVYGNPIDFRGLRHEPVNENGVIFLFGIVARELGYSVEAVQAGFLIAKQSGKLAQASGHGFVLSLNMKAAIFVITGILLIAATSSSVGDTTGQNALIILRS
jgi:hypothetical protein